MNIKKIKDRLSRAFEGLLGVSRSRASLLLPSNLTAGKAYEAHVLSVICEELKIKESCKLILKNGNTLVLKTSGGGINRNYPWIEVQKNGRVIGEIFTDIEFIAFSYSASGSIGNPTLGEYHELDIVVTEPGATDRPRHDQLLLGVECKNTEYQKNLLKEILGIRREMGLLAGQNKTSFSSWPSRTVPADPPSCLLVYSTSPKITNYSRPGRTFGIEFIYETM